MSRPTTTMMTQVPIYSRTKRKRKVYTVSWRVIKNSKIREDLLNIVLCEKKLDSQNIGWAWRDRFRFRVMSGLLRSTRTKKKKIWKMKRFQIWSYSLTELRVFTNLDSKLSIWCYLYRAPDTPVILKNSHISRNVIWPINYFFPRIHTVVGIYTQLFQSLADRCLDGLRWWSTNHKTVPPDNF